MGSWKFTDDYGARFPALAASVLAKLLFVDHSLANGAFSGSLDLAGSGEILAIPASLLNAKQMAVTGTVSERDGTLSVVVQSSDEADFAAALGTSVPVLGGVCRGAKLTISTVVASKDPADKRPGTDSIELMALFAIGPHTAQMSAILPSGGGYITLAGAFQGVGLKLDDLEFLLGGRTGAANWFPQRELGPYAPSNGAALELLGLSLSMYVAPQPRKVTVTSTSAVVGITKIPLLEDKLYLNPLAVWITLNRVGPKPQVLWGIGGTLMLTNHEHRDDLSNPDLSFTLGLTVPDFTLSGHLANPKKQPLSVIVKDLLGEDKSIGFADKIVLEKFDFSATADKTTGKLASFSGELGMSGGFGLLERLEVESMSLRIAHRV